jgi:hypothetical protein
MSNEVENLKLRAGASKAPVGIVPMHPLFGMSRVLEDSAVKYAPFNYMAQSLVDALESYDNAVLRHRILCTELGGRVTPETYAALDDDSGLPHIFHMIDGLMILATLMIRDGVLPLDPGTGKRKLASLTPQQEAIVDGWEQAARDAADRAARDPQMNAVIDFDKEIADDFAKADPDTTNYEPVGGMRW